MSEDTSAGATEHDRTNAEQAGPPTEAKKPRSRTRARSKPDQAQDAVSGLAATTRPTAKGGAAEPDSMDRAEQIVAEWTVRAERIGSEIGHQIVRLFARAREEAEDIWAEAQEIRRSEGIHQDESQK